MGIYKNFVISVLFLCALPINSALSNTNTEINNTWHIVELKGVVHTRSGDNSPWQLTRSTKDHTGPFYLRTGENTRVVLKHRNDEITIASNSMMKFEAERISKKSILTKVFQSIGYSLFKIEKNSGRQNIIETPYLVSVVKGTTFSVQTDSQGASVNLIEGRLLVTLPDRSAQQIITTGQIAKLVKGDKSISVSKRNHTASINDTSSVGLSKKSSNANENSTKKGNNSNKSNNGKSQKYNNISSVINDSIHGANANGNAFNIPTTGNGRNTNKNDNGNNGNNGNN